MHIVIIGNGIIALATAFELTQRLAPSDRVTIIGPPTRPGSASMAAGAMLNAFGEIERGTLDDPMGMARFELAHAARHLWPKFEQAIIARGRAALPPACQQCDGASGGGCYGHGTVILDTPGENGIGTANFDAIQSALTQFNEPFDVIAPETIPGYAARPPAHRALLVHNEGWLNPRIVLDKLDGVLRAHPQIEFVLQSVARIVVGSNGIAHAQCDDGTDICGDVFVLANGANASQLVDRSGLDFGVQPTSYGIGVSVEVALDTPVDHCIRTPKTGPGRSLYAVPRFQGPGQVKHVLIGATSKRLPTPAQIDASAAARALLADATARINADFAQARVINVYTGWRPETRDGYPLIGPTSAQNLFLASGTGRDGFHLAPLIAVYLSEMIVENRTDPRFAPFLPDRTPYRPTVHSLAC